MAIAKTRTSIFNAVTLTAGAGNTNGAAIDMSAGNGGQLNLKLTNGGTGPTIAAQYQITCTNNTGGTIYVNDGGPLVGSVTASTAVSWSINIPKDVVQVLVTAGSNTGQNVTADGDISVTSGGP